MLALTNHVNVVSRPAPRKHPKEIVTRPSGLVKNWQSKGISQGGRNGRASTPRDVTVPSGDVLGGLADEDAGSERPSPKMPRGRDVTRKNEASHRVCICSILG
jgi:hypothetical protein